MLCDDSTSNGATMPGKITISERPRIGSTLGSDFAAGRGGAASPAAFCALRMLINSVSGELTYSLDATVAEKVHPLIPCKRSQSPSDIGIVAAPVPAALGTSI